MLIEQMNDSTVPQKDATPQKDIKLHEKNYCIDFHGAAIIDADGNEIAITEEMVLGACEALDEHWPINPYQYPHQS